MNIYEVGLALERDSPRESCGNCVVEFIKEYCVMLGWVVPDRQREERPALE